MHNSMLHEKKLSITLKSKDFSHHLLPLPRWKQQYGVH